MAVSSSSMDHLLNLFYSKQNDLAEEIRSEEHEFVQKMQHALRLVQSSRPLRKPLAVLEWRNATIPKRTLEASKTPKPIPTATSSKPPIPTASKPSVPFAMDTSILDINELITTRRQSHSILDSSVKANQSVSLEMERKDSASQSLSVSKKRDSCEATSTDKGNVLPDPFDPLSLAVVQRSPVIEEKASATVTAIENLPIDLQPVSFAIENAQVSMEKKEESVPEPERKRSCSRPDDFSVPTIPDASCDTVTQLEDNHPSTINATPPKRLFSIPSYSPLTFAPTIEDDTSKKQDCELPTLRFSDISSITLLSPIERRGSQSHMISLCSPESMVGEFGSQRSESSLMPWQNKVYPTSGLESSTQPPQSTRPITRLPMSPPVPRSTILTPSVDSMKQTSRDEEKKAKREAMAKRWEQFRKLDSQKKMPLSTLQTTSSTSSRIPVSTGPTASSSKVTAASSVLAEKLRRAEEKRAQLEEIARKRREAESQKREEERKRREKEEQEERQRREELARQREEHIVEVQRRKQLFEEERKRLILEQIQQREHGALLGTGGYQQDTELDTEEKEVEVAGVDQRSSEYCTLPDSSSTELKEKESVSVGFGTVAPRPSSTSPQSSSFHPSNSSSTNATATPLAKCITPEFEGRDLVPLSVSSQNTTVSGQNSSGMLNQSQSSRSSQPSSGTSVAASSFECYEMSDREDNSDWSDDDEEEDSDATPKKKIPTWATRPALQAELVAQSPIDPDRIFPAMSKTCDLEDIFGAAKRKRYRQRTSSARWSPDHFTPREEFLYKVGMGFR